MPLPVATTILGRGITRPSCQTTTNLNANSAEIFMTTHANGGLRACQEPFPSRDGPSLSNPLQGVYLDEMKLDEYLVGSTVGGSAAFARRPH